jgi:DNA-binding transcriptional MerR regulator
MVTIVTTGYKIKELADRSGFTPTTLRYYEEIGLLPPAQRTPAGYRVYDDSAVDRLGFIARAKQLGCTLDEIADLATAWEGGRCGPVQDRLRSVVADKLDRSQDQLAELIALQADLQRAASALERHRPDGACDARCGCVSEPESDTSAVPQLVSLMAGPSAGDDAPIACSLGQGELRNRVDEWQAVLTHVDRREPIVGGVRAVFGSTVPLEELIRLVAAEQECCQFFAFAITVDRRGIALEVTAPIEASAIVESLFGAPA